MNRSCLQMFGLWRAFFFLFGSHFLLSRENMGCIASETDVTTVLKHPDKLKAFSPPLYSISVLNLHFHTLPETTSRWRPGGPPSGLEEVSLCCGHPGQLLGGCGSVSVSCSRCGLTATRLCCQMQLGWFGVLLKATKSEVALQQATSCLLLQRKRLAFMSRPLYPQ